MRFDERYLRPTEVDALIGDRTQGRTEAGLEAAGAHARTRPHHGRRRPRGPQARGRHVDRHAARLWPSWPISIGLSDNQSFTLGPRRNASTSPATGDWSARRSGARCEAAGFNNLVGEHVRRTRSDRSRRGASTSSRDQDRRYVVLAAAKVGGILANNTYPVDFLSRQPPHPDQRAGRRARAPVDRVCSSSARPASTRSSPAADPEDSLLTGHLEPTNDAYAIAKIAGILHVQAVRRQYGLPWISAMPTNLYGPGDNFSPDGLARAARHSSGATTRRAPHGVPR